VSVTESKTGGTEERRPQEDREVAVESTHEEVEASGKIEGFLGSPAEAAALVTETSFGKCAGQMGRKWASRVRDGWRARGS